jgi:hypothetical protein
MGLGSGIRDPRSGIQGSKRHRISATLHLSPFCLFFKTDFVDLLLSLSNSLIICLSVCLRIHHIKWENAPKPPVGVYSCRCRWQQWWEKYPKYRDKKISVNCIIQGHSVGLLVGGWGASSFLAPFKIIFLFDSYIPPLHLSFHFQ